MKRLMSYVGLLLVSVLLLFAANFASVGNDNTNRNQNSSAAAHAAAVKQCKDEYRTARDSAMRIKVQSERNAALTKAQSDYDACVKSANTRRY